MGRDEKSSVLAGFTQCLGNPEQIQVLLAPSAIFVSSFMEEQSRPETFITMGKRGVIFEGNKVQRLCCKSSGLKIYLMHLPLFNRQEEMKGNFCKGFCSYLMMPLLDELWHSVPSHAALKPTFFKH